MTGAKGVRLKAIPAKIANPFIKRRHYSGKAVPNSRLHLGAFLDGRLHGAMGYGPSLDKRKTQGLAEGTTWNGFLELNRMAFDDREVQRAYDAMQIKNLRFLGQLVRSMRYN